LQKKSPAYIIVYTYFMLFTKIIMEKQSKSLLPKLMSFVFIAMGIFLGIYAFFADASNWTLAWGSWWNNDNYLSWSFWNNSPSDYDIITALYGTGNEGSIYTQNWTGYTSGSCLSAGMTVVYTGKLSLTTLSPNTIYVLTWPVSTWSSTITMANCSAVISNQNTWTLFQSTTQLINGIFYWNISQNTIFDNISLNGTWWGMVPAHTANNEWIKLPNGWYLNTTINTTNIYNTNEAAILISAWSHVSISNSALYNNPVWLYIEEWGYITTNNIDMYNNYWDWAMFAELSCDHCSFNNMQVHNNSVWLWIWWWSYTILNNIQSYNNQSIWISISSSVHTVFHNVASYNNQYGLYQYAGSDITYYDTNKFFNNTIQIYWTLTTWLSTTYQDLWRGWWILTTTWIYSWDIVANPVNTLGNYLLVWTGTASSLKWIRSSYLTTTTHAISYGSGIATQIQPVLYSGTTLTTWGSFDTTKFIWSDSSKVTWDILWLHPYSSTTGIILTWTSINGWITTYSLFGDITTFRYNQPINTSTGIMLTTWYNTIITQLSSALGRFSLHFQKETIVDMLSPTFTWTTLSWTSVVSGAYYTTGVTITFNDTNISGATLNGAPYSSGTLIASDGTYIFFVQDLAGNFTGVSFTIDSTKPTFTWTTLVWTSVVSGAYYTTGVTITFNDTNISGATLNGTPYSSGTLIASDGTYIFFVQDLAGNFTGVSFTIDSTKPTFTWPTLVWTFNYTGGNDIAFLRSGTDVHMSWYTLYFTGTQSNTIYTTATWSTQTLLNGTYTRYIVATDRAGNTWVSSILPFMITTPLSGTVSITGTNIIYNVSTAYTKDYVSLYLQPNQPCNYTITWDIALGTMTWFTSWWIIISPYLTWSNWTKNIYFSFSNGGETITRTISVYLDTIAPVPTLVSPTSWTTLTGWFNLLWSPVWADAVGLSWYQYFVSTTWTFATFIKTWFTTTTWIAITAWEFGTTWTFYRYVQSLDKLNNSWASAIWSFSYSGVNDTTPDTFYFNRVTNARIERIYASNTLTISWLTADIPVLASIDIWALYISWVMVGTTWYIQNGWTVKIEMTSSDEYDDDVISTLTIGGVSATFRITTMEEDEDTTDTDYEDIDTNLSSSEKLIIIAIFETLRDLYAGDKEKEFFNTLMVMLENQMDTFDENDEEYDGLKYLYDIANQYYDEWDFDDSTVDDTSWIVNGIYTAPNGKKYTITYDSSKQWFTSTNFVVPKYFPTLDTLKYIIDINNPAGSQYANAKTILARWKSASIDGTWQTSPYTAPNKKVFYFFKDINERYSSYTFTTERYFDSLDDVKEFIYNSNK